MIVIIFKEAKKLSLLLSVGLNFSLNYSLGHLHNEAKQIFNLRKEKKKQSSLVGQISTPKELAMNADELSKALFSAHHE